ncbi:MAG: peptidase C45 [Cytophagales bacterium]|nr:peptidase C45 [Armatimonadota bacterium]
MTLPVVFLSGAPREQGLQHGRALKDRIAQNVALYFERFDREVGLPRSEVHAIARQYADAIARQNPAYHAGMEGVAEGSGFPLADIAALNVRYEILYYQFGKNAIAAAQARSEGVADGCTAFAALPAATASGHLLMGQNWDWIPEVQGAVLHTTDEDGFETLAYTESGIVGAKIGFNQAGLGLCINGMTTVDDDWSRLSRPFHVRCWEMLRCRTLEAAQAVIAGEARACSTNFLIAQTPGNVVDIEAAPDKINLLGCDRAGCLTHANHFVDPGGLGIEEAPNERRIFSQRRAARLSELLHARLPLTTEGIQDALRDTQDDPFGICRHRNPAEPPEMHYITVTAVVMDLETRTLHLTDGPPDESPFQTVSL